MTTFEKDYKDALEGNGIDVLKRRKAELERLDKELRCCRNNFRAECIFQEIQKKKMEYRKIDDLF